MLNETGIKGIIAGVVDPDKRSGGETTQFAQITAKKVPQCEENN